MNLQEVTEWNRGREGETESHPLVKAQGKNTSSLLSRTNTDTSKPLDTCAKLIRTIGP